MRDNRKSTDPGLSAAERKAQRSREAQEAIADLEKAQRAFHENRERLRKERLRREEAARPIPHPGPQPPPQPPPLTFPLSTGTPSSLQSPPFSRVSLAVLTH